MECACGIIDINTPFPAYVRQNAVIFLWLAARACRKLRRLWLDIPILLSPSAPHKERKLKPERFKLRLTLEYPKRALVHRRTSLYAGRTRCFQKGGETPLVALGLRERAQLLISAMALLHLGLPYHNCGGTTPPTQSSSHTQGAYMRYPQASVVLRWVQTITEASQLRPEWVMC